ncbi:MAG: 16S rRNA (cytidine(1402)-2'-O)-methyltransferase [Rhodospirillaceae bacterium]|nr:16S rRNA (cytidine(1402)-2'-O)-methyltransferase [Rhodospirillaceae bacterium]
MSSRPNTSGAPQGEQVAAGLHVVGVPIGNLGDITLRALATLGGVDAVACEDTRVTARLLGHYGLTKPLIAYHDHNAAEVRPRLLARLAEGAALALVTDAGMPAVSDPGYKLVRAAREAGCKVHVVPGASAVTAAVVAAGLPTDRFLFAGFLPNKAQARKAAWAELAALPTSLVVFESAKRLAASLADLAAVDGAREVAVTRELTKLFEEVRRGTAAELAETYAREGPPKGEVTLVVGPPGPRETEAVDLDAALRAALVDASVRDAADLVAEATGLPRRTVYQRALALAADRP